MNWWESLIGKFQIKNPKIFNGVRILSTGDKKFNITVENLTLMIANPGDASPAIQQEIKEAIRKEFENKTELISNDSHSIKSDFPCVAELEENTPVLSFFRGKISDEKFTLLSAALYLRTVYRSGDFEKSGHLKQQIILRYGKEGSSVSNLCTAGYYESNIIPLLTELEQNRGLLSKDFESIYDDLVREFPIAVFIHQYMSIDDVKEGILSKLERNKKYGINFLIIHGIGETNNKVIEEVVSSIVEGKYGVISEKNSEGAALKIKLSLAESSKRF